MKIEEYFESLPKSIISGDQVELADSTLRDVFKFLELDSDDVFYHIGSGFGNGIRISLEEFSVKKAVGIEIDNEKNQKAHELLSTKKLQNWHLVNQDILDTQIEDDATAILFWFHDSKIVDEMKKRFEKLKEGTKIVTIWAPLPGTLPYNVDFPFIMNRVPFAETDDLAEQTKAVFGTECIDFVTAWEFAERYTKAVNPDPSSENDRFLTIMQTLVIWINAKNLGIACGKEIPQPIQNYMKILKNYFNIDVEYLLSENRYQQ